MTSDVWVWSWLPGDVTPTLSGLFKHETVGARRRGRFVYGRSYLANRDALALDPIQLKLADRTYETLNLQGFFGPIRDAMPDDWGRYVIEHLHGAQAELTAFLLLSGGDHIGNLGFSTSREEPPSDPVLHGFDILKPAGDLMRGLDEGRPVDPRLEQMVRANTALGGARPKLTIQHDGKQWIAKFPAREDRGAPIAKIEAAMLELSRDCGIDAAHARVVHDEILLVERFDRAFARAQEGEGWRRDAFLSAQTIFYANAEVQAYAVTGSYARLAIEMARFSDELARNREQLFRRMVFNCCISNTDDHDRNHGFLASDTPGRYTLSPAYDMVPRRHGTIRHEHALTIGDEGFVATRQNILSGAASFGFSQRGAVEILDEVQARVSESWEARLHEQGLTAEQVQQWAVCFKPVPEKLPPVEQHARERTSAARR